ncbi:MAG: hypothetical protein JWM83_1734, partial [Candidatus Angelobacter sp.]|nr:hypothetical protein [Candidatus Angelobacter sp.]
MKKVKTSVRENDFFSSRTPLANLGCKFTGREDFLCRAGQSALPDGAQKFSAGYCSGAAFHHHN